MGSKSKQESSSSPVFFEDPRFFGRGERRGSARRAIRSLIGGSELFAFGGGRGGERAAREFTRGLRGDPAAMAAMGAARLGVTDPFASQEGQQLRQLLSGGAPAVGAGEQAILDAAARQAGLGTTLRGAAPTQAGVVQATAPLLQGFRQQNIANLFGALQGQMGARGQGIQALMQLAEMGRRRRQVTTQQRSRQSSFTAKNPFEAIPLVGKPLFG